MPKHNQQQQQQQQQRKRRNKNAGSPAKKQVCSFSHSFLK
jgi:hypothetical protein